MTREKREQFIVDLYRHQVDGGKDSGQITFANLSAEEKRESLAICDYWEQHGVIDIIAQATGFVVVRLTAYGIDFVEKNLL